MKRFYLSFYIILIIFFTGAVFLFRSGQMLNQSPSQVNMLAVNRIARQLSENWEAFCENSTVTVDSAYAFIVFDQNGDLLFRSDDSLPKSKGDAVQLGMVSWDITISDESNPSLDRVLGTMYLETGSSAQWQDRLNDWHVSFVIFLSVTGLLLVLFFLLCYFRIIAPFRKLQKFAAEICDGNFDKPLPMDRYHLFGAFTESFDIMRTSLKEAQQKAILLDKSKKELVASLSHDIRTPVTSIKVVLELLLLQHQGDSALTQKLLSVHTKVEQIEQLSSNLLSTTLEDLDELSVNLTSMASSFLKTLIDDANSDGFISCDDIPACMITLDTVRTRQVFDNIISNSRKYAATPITISSHIDGNYLHVCIEDTGCALLPDELELVCTQYYRGSAALASGKEGEGLGLYLVHKMMKKMDGDMEVYNCHPGFGVRLLFSLGV